MHFSKHDHYKKFIDFVQADVARERSSANRRMAMVLFWCVLCPAITVFGFALMVRLGWMPLRFRAGLDWAVLFFPVAYSLYILGSEVIATAPATLRRGSLFNALAQSESQGEWREKTCEALSKMVGNDADDWSWIHSSFAADLQAMKYRASYLTALAGAVLFLISQGLDWISEESAVPSALMRPGQNGTIEWIQSADLSQFVGLAFFLTLLYLSGSQAAQSLRKYLDCAALMSLRRE